MKFSSLAKVFKRSSKDPKPEHQGVETPTQGPGIVARVKELFDAPAPPVPPPPSQEFISQLLIRNRRSARRRALREKRAREIESGSSSGVSSDMGSEGSWDVSDSE